jgi:single-strand DNA-binding protein
MNKIILVGRLTKDPEVRTTSAGFNTVNFTVAVNRNFKNKDGNYDADFLPCVAFRQTADFISKFFKKGNMICLDGRVQTRSYDAQDGSKRYVTEVVVENVEFVGGKNESSSSSARDNSYVDAPAAAPIDEIPEYDVPSQDPYENYDKEVSLSDNDLPF